MTRRSIGNKGLERIVIITGKRSKIEEQRRYRYLEKRKKKDEAREKGIGTKNTSIQHRGGQESIPAYVCTWINMMRAIGIFLPIFVRSVALLRPSVVSLTPNTNARLSARRFFRLLVTGRHREPYDLNVHMYTNKDSEQLYRHERKSKD